MEKFSSGEQKSLANFFNNFAVAWTTAGIVAPAFTQSLNISVRMLYFLAGMILGSASLWISLVLSKNFND